MLQYALVFFVIALIAVFFGFGGIATATVGIARLLFIGLMVLAVIGAAVHFFANRKKPQR